MSVRRTRKHTYIAKENVWIEMEKREKREEIVLLALK